MSRSEMLSAVDQERVRAETAEARVSELEGEVHEAESRANEWKYKAIVARSKMGSFKAMAESNRTKLSIARDELKTRGRSQRARNVRKLECENARLHGVLKSSEIDPIVGSTTELRKEIFRLKGEVAQKNEEIAELKAANERLRSTNVIHSKARFGDSSEKKKRRGQPVNTGKSGSTGKRGQRAGKPGHGRTHRPQLETKIETHNPPDEDLICECCGQPYVQNGCHESEFIEIEVKTHTRKIRRPRWRKTCDCESTSKEIAAPPVPRLFRNTAYGISFWAMFLLECYAFYRPINRVAAWLSDRQLPVSSGTLASSISRMVPLFEPLSLAILNHLKSAGTLHGDETSWRVQELRSERGTGLAWLWCAGSQNAVWFRVDKRRNTEAALKLFEGVAPETFLVCDAYQAYTKLARLLGDDLTLVWCWVHVRRKFIQAAAGNTAFAKWEQRWLDRIGRLYHLNRVRLKHYRPDVGLDEQSRNFHTAQRQLQSAVHRMFHLAENELKGPGSLDRRATPLKSLVKHREGLIVFVDHPKIPMDNNFAERVLRGPVIGRKLTFGSDSQTGAAFSATMFGIFETLRMNGIDLTKWLTAWLTACAENGGRPPDDLIPWLPWSMSEERRRTFANLQ